MILPVMRHFAGGKSWLNPGPEAGVTTIFK